MTGLSSTLALPDVSAITARIGAIEQLIAAVTGGRVATTAGVSATTGTSGSATSFASTLSAATATEGGGAVTASSAQNDGSVTGAQIVADAQQYLGIPYVWGGESGSGLDCSGLVRKTFGDLGITLPRVAADQQKVGTPVASLAAAQPGDLLFFGRPAYHVAIYAGDNKLIESPQPGQSVHLTSVYQTPTSISRIVAATASGTTTTAGSGLSATALQSAGISPRVAAYADQFAAAEQANGLPAGLLAAVCQQESGGNPNAVSVAGAQGLMQIMPATAAGMGIDPLDPSASISAAGTILGRNLKGFGSVPLALAAYNAGGGAVRQYGGIPPYAETQNYVRRITATLAAGG